MSLPRRRPHTAHPSTAYCPVPKSPAAAAATPLPPPVLALGTPGPRASLVRRRLPCWFVTYSRPQPRLAGIADCTLGCAGAGVAGHSVGSMRRNSRQRGCP